MRRIERCYAAAIFWLGHRTRAIRRSGTELEALINGVPTQLESVYLRVNGQTLASSFDYGTITQYYDVSPGTASLSALDTSGYRVGPLRSPGLSAGKRYTLILLGSYPNYSVLAYEEPPASAGAQLSLYEASPTAPKAEFGTFAASAHSHFTQLGTASLGSVTTVALGKHVTNVGGYVAAAGGRLGTVTPSQLNSFDRHNELPFHAIARLSLFLFDPISQGANPVFGSLDQ